MSAHRAKSPLAVALVLLFLAASGLVGGTATAQPLPDTPNRLRLDINQFSPRVLDTDSETLTVSGTVTNVGDRRISDLTARLQLGARQDAEREIADSLSEPPPTDASMTSFVDVADVLEPGQSAPLRLTAPLNAGPDSLTIEQIGVYPLLVNVNGTPEYGGAARLASMNMLVPVLGVPGGAAPEPPGTTTDVTMLWPIADTRPRIVAAPYNGQVVLSDDELATALAPGGRLNGLVSAAEAARDDGQVFDSLCFGLDPDLLETVEAMARGYQVRTSSGTVAGSGTETAKRWLESLRNLVRGKCIVQLPFADADLSTLSRVRRDGSADRELSAAAVNGAPTIQRLLGMRPLGGVLWPSGPLDRTAASWLGQAGISAVLTPSGELEPTRPGDSGVRLTDTSLRAQPFDSLVARSLSGTPAAGGALTPADEPDVAVQNGLAALAFRTGLGDERSGGPLLVAPPHGWTAPEGELRTMLDTVGALMTAGYAAPASLQQLLGEEPSGEATIGYAASEVSVEVSADVTDAMSEIDTTIGDLVDAMSVDATLQIEPEELTRPLRNGLLRASSTAWPDLLSRRNAVADADAQVEAMRKRVTVETPGQPLTLASGSSPLPLYLTNDLPVVMTVRVELANASGLRPAPVGDLTIPAGAKVTQRIPTEALRAGRFSVVVSLTTPGGTELGTPARFELNSNEYGVITLVLTAGAAGALLLLSGRRIYRRIKERKAAAQ
ncbi:hypothetical protein SAMN05216266_101565 [Amycolatopsis marina]|uniref:Glycoprotein n=1 Tax=Amycolatopsis marina TaxID=490629 RepID=A0A1I0VX84_9PSEU|nr:DUF6049 family protein [Amycolatopsis marina]SFA80904.1 hypothetical protein SAMN05216266_101565 [Amycolatopsis marina]